MVLFWRVVILLVAVNTALIAGVRAQDEHYPEIEALLMPSDGCRMPCFLGIQMGHTRAEEAIAILEAHPYVGDVRTVGIGGRGGGSVRWYWADDAPNFLAGFRDNVLELNSNTEIVTSITLYVFIPTGEVWRYIDNHETENGVRLSDYIRVDGPNCNYNMLGYYQSVPQRIFYMPTPATHPIPYKPRRALPKALQC